MINWQQQCEIMWGRGWKRILAITTCRKTRQVRRWISGDAKIKEVFVFKINETYEHWKDIWGKDA